MTQQEAVDWLFSRTRIASVRVHRITLEHRVTKSEDTDWCHYTCYMHAGDKCIISGGKTPREAVESIFHKFVSGSE